MKTLATPVTVVNGMSTINKISVVSWLDFSHLAIPYGLILCQVQGPGGKIYSGPNQFYTLNVSDSGQCVSLQVNPNPLSAVDQLVVGTTMLAGTPYTTVSQLYDSTVGTRAAKLMALEDQMVAWGLWPAALTGT
jgi:hypothetical protein